MLKLNKVSNSFVAVLALSALGSASAMAVEGSSMKAGIDQGSAMTRSQLSSTIAEFEMSEMDLNDMKDTLVRDFADVGLSHELSQVMDRFETRDQLLSALKSTQYHQSVAGQMFMANTRHLLGMERGTSSRALFGTVVWSFVTLAADIGLAPTALLTDLGNYFYADAGSKNYMGYFGRHFADSEMTDGENACAAWLTLGTVPMDLLLSPFYVMATIYRSGE